MPTFHFRYVDTRLFNLFVLYLLGSAIVFGLIYTLATQHWPNQPWFWLGVLTLEIAGGLFLWLRTKKHGSAQLSTTQLQLTLDRKTTTLNLSHIKKCLCTGIRGRYTLTLLLNDDSYIGITDARLSGNDITNLSQAIKQQLSATKQAPE